MDHSSHPKQVELKENNVWQLWKYNYEILKLYTDINHFKFDGNALMPTGNASSSLMHATLPNTHNRDANEMKFKKRANLLNIHII